jgi:YegS/Rv2252/BmrU family lipid kinase
MAGREKVLVVVNAKAGSADAESVQRAVEFLREKGQGQVEVRRCGEPEDLERALDEHREQDGTVVVAGGDGTIHQVVHTLHARGELGRRVLGLLPLGTGNDLARNLGIPREPERAARLVLHGEPRSLDLLVDDEGGVVLNAVHVGVGAVAATSAARFKPYLKAAAFPVGAVLAGIRTGGWRLRIEADGEVVAHDKLLMIALSNAPGIAGGTAQLAPDAVPHDGRLDLTVSAATGPIARIGYALGLRDGTHRHRDDVLHTSAKTVTITGDAFPVNTDGEVSGPFTKRTWTLVSGAWRIIAPAA